jgi:hypothetical protein
VRAIALRVAADCIDNGEDTEFCRDRKRLGDLGNSRRWRMPRKPAREA